MAKREHTPPARVLEEALTVLFCVVYDAYRSLNPGGRRYAALKKLSDSEVMTLALFQQLRGVESERSFLRDVARFFSRLFSGVVGLLAPSSFHRRVRKLRRLLEPLRRSVLPELVGDPETLIIDSTLLPVLHPRQVSRSAAGFEGAAWVRWGAFSVYGVKLPLVCATNRVPICYEPTAANVAEMRLVGELLAEAALPGEELARKLLGGLAYRSGDLQDKLADAGVLLVTDRGAQGGKRQRAEIAFSSLKRVFGIGRTLAKTLVGLATRIVAKIAAYTYAFYVNRLLARPQGRMKELWA
jgi:hypothetical protein